LRELKELALPETLDELWEKKAQYGPRALVIAGGTEIVSDPPEGVECLIDIRHLGLNRIGETESLISIGATTTMETLAHSPVVASLAQGMLCQSSCQGWPAPVRSAATLGGNLAGGDPFADTPAALLALGAQVVLQTHQGEVLVPIDDFFLDYRKTAAGDAVLAEVRIPKTPPEGKGAFLKCAPSSIDKAMINLGVYVEIVDGRCFKVRVAVGAVTRIPHRVMEVEALLSDCALEPELIEEAADLVARSVEPMLDIRASVEKRRSLLSVLFKRAAHQVAQAV
jgi:CO/xanthine dehydrogenase FAD-binding subunit